MDTPEELASTKIRGLKPGRWHVEGTVTKHHVGILCLECSRKHQGPVKFAFIEELNAWICPCCKHMLTFNLVPIGYSLTGSEEAKSEWLKS